ncbi:MAG: OmpA family protein [Acidobacteriota bacterium]
MRNLIPTAVIVLVAGCTTQPSQTHLFDVFFESNKASLAPEARGIVDQIASAAHSEQPSRIVVAGEATGGTPRDAKLASERADAVVQALVAAAVDPSLIDKQTTLVNPAAPTVADRVASHKVQIELVSEAAIAQRPNRMPAQWVRSPRTHEAPVANLPAER